MDDLSNLRLAGVVVGFAVLIWTFVDLRRYRARRVDRAAIILFALASITLALFPQLVDAPAAFFGLLGVPGGRLLALLIVSTVLVWLLLIRARSQLAALQDDLTATLRSLAVSDFLGRHADLARTPAIWVVVPVLNEAANIGVVAARVPRALLGLPVRVLVVDDGSTDGSAAVAAQAGALVARLPRNCGGGTALLTGFDVALNENAFAIVTMDGDGQHDPAEVERLVTPLAEKRADFVIGSRVLGSRDERAGLRAIGISLFSRLINLLTGSRITDCSSGFRAISPQVLRTIQLREPQYHTPELIISVTKRRMVVAEVPIHVRSRLSGESKKGPDLRYGWRFIRSIVRAWLR
ncbi:MAG: DUF2304 family protein [Gammaproteobacteria bacterium]